MLESASILQIARLEKKRVKKLSEKNPSLTLAMAYQIQETGIQLRLLQGEKRVGFKMGLTSLRKQEQMHVNKPIYGILTDQMQLPSEGASLLYQNYIHPKVEPEIAFLIGKNLEGEISRKQALEACSGICVAMDIIDSRYENFQFTLPDVIADNASAAAFLLGPIRHFSPGMDINNLSVRLKVNKITAASGNTKDIFGDPFMSVVHLCGLLAEQGHILPAGSVVLAGSATEAVSLAPGMSILVEIEGLGLASLNIC